MRGVWDFRKGQGGEHPVEGIAFYSREVSKLLNSRLLSLGFLAFGSFTLIYRYFQEPGTLLEIQKESLNNLYSQLAHSSEGRTTYQILIAKY